MCGGGGSLERVCPLPLAALGSAHTAHGHHLAREGQLVFTGSTAALGPTRAAAYPVVGETRASTSARPQSSVCHRCSAAKLKAVKVDMAQVDALAHEFDLPKSVAERQLRLAAGDVHAAYQSLMGLR